MSALTKVALITCMVYDLIDPDNKSFFVGVNGDRVNGPIGKDVDLTVHQVEVLENAIIDTVVRNSETNKEEPYRKERFKVMKLSQPFYLINGEKVPVAEYEAAQKAEAEKAAEEGKQ